MHFKGTVSQDFLLLVFFHESVSRKPLSTPVESFQIFSKIRGEICSSRLTTGIIDTGGKFSTVVNDTDGKIAAGINDTGGKFATGINDSSNKFCHQFH
jgi:hypothetical protein